MQTLLVLLPALQHSDVKIAYRPITFVQASMLAIVTFRLNNPFLCCERSLNLSRGSMGRSGRICMLTERGMDPGRGGGVGGTGARPA